MQNPSDRPDRLRNTGIMFGTLLFFWVLLVQTLAVDTLLTGVLISLAIAWLYPSGLSFFSEFRGGMPAIVAGFRYYGYFFRQLVRSNLRLAAIVISPELPVDPGIVKIRTNLKSRMGRLMLANSITLTPGTLTVEIDDEWLYVHCVRLGATDVEGATEEIAAEFERYLKVIYG
jgi:multicomponent Na+:H+ antiporter subunit E